MVSAASRVYAKSVVSMYCSLIGPNLGYDIRQLGKRCLLEASNVIEYT